MKRQSFNQRFLDAVKFSQEQYGVAIWRTVMWRLWPDPPAAWNDGRSQGQRISRLRRACSAHGFVIARVSAADSPLPANCGVPVIVKKVVLGARSFEA